MFLPCNGPIDLGHTLGSGQTFRWRREDDAHVGILGENIFRVWESDGGVEFESSPAPPEKTAERLRSYLRLEDDIDSFYQAVADDPRLSVATGAYRGLRLARQDPWECLVTFVISSYSNIKRITKHVAEISEAFGDQVKSHDGVYTFPGPARLAEVPEREFRRMGLGYRARFLTRVAEQVLQLPHGLMPYRQASYIDAKQALLSFFGVGDKVADCVLAFSLDQSRAFPIDVWVRRAVQEWYFAGDPVSDRDIRQWAFEHFGEYASYAQQYLFHRRRVDG